MATLVKEINSITRYAEFAITSADELELLPTTTTAGKENLSTIKNCCAGSAAYTVNGNLDIYILNGETDTWVLS